MATLREDVMGWVRDMATIGDADAITGRWYLLEGEEQIDPTQRNQIIELRGGTIVKAGQVVGRYVIAERHLELALDDEPTIFMWRTPETFLIGAQEFKNMVGDPVEGEPWEAEVTRVRLSMERVPNGSEPEPMLLPDLEAV